MSQPANGAQPVEVTRLLCISVCQVEGSVMDDLLGMRNALNVTARPVRVRSALLHANGWFVLWLEGPADAVEIVRARTASDPRNLGQTVIHRSTGPASLVAPFEMVSTQCSETTAEAGRRIRKLAKQHESLEPAALWQALSSPSAVAGPGNLAGQPGHHIGLISAEDNGPIDVLRALGEKFGSKVVYQRFAGAQRYTSDVGVAYVDVALGGEVRRVQLLSRRALGYRMVRSSLRGLNSLVMLLGHRPAAAIELAHSVAACVETIPARPTVYVFNATDTMTSTIASLMARGDATAGRCCVVSLVSGIAEFLTQPRHPVAAA